MTVTGWDQPRVAIEASIEPDGSDDPSQLEKVRLTEVRIESSGNDVRIKSDYEAIKEEQRWWKFEDGDHGTLPLVRYTLRMPRGAAFRLKDHKSRVRVSGLDGELDIDCYKGVVNLADVPGVRLKTYKGEVLARFDRFERDSSFETYKGDITLEIPARAGFDLDADTGKKGDLNSDFEIAVRASGRDGDDRSYRGKVNGGGPELRLETDKGSFRIRQK
ncbi:MAG: DUF4097 family beta strand repeat-containing protein [Thermoanaerobaculia bacterium]